MRHDRRAAARRWAAPWGVLAAVLAAVSLTLGYATHRRNWDYRSPLAIWQDTVHKRPENFFAHHNLANALAQDGRLDEAMQSYQKALQRQPALAEAYNDMGLARARLGQSGEAIDCYQRALHLKPHDAAAHYNLANALVALGKSGEAMAHYKEALRWKPDFAPACYNLGLVLDGLGRTAEAVGYYRKALDLEPDDVEGHCVLAVALSGMGEPREAVEHYEQALRLNADCLVALNNLAWLLATSEPASGGDPSRAVPLAERARALGGQTTAACLDTLAAAYAAAGRFPEALTTAEQAIQLAASAGQTALAKEIQSRCDLYRAGRPYRAAARPIRPSTALP
jgi:superkiller protein 3